MITNSKFVLEHLDINYLYTLELTFENLESIDQSKAALYIKFPENFSLAEDKKCLTFASGNSFDCV